VSGRSAPDIDSPRYGGAQTPVCVEYPTVLMRISAMYRQRRANAAHCGRQRPVQCAIAPKHIRIARLESDQMPSSRLLRIFKRTLSRVLIATERRKGRSLGNNTNSADDPWSASGMINGTMRVVMLAS
jgi:hypothetical protein